MAAAETLKSVVISEEGDKYPIIRRVGRHQLFRCKIKSQTVITKKEEK